MAKFCHRARTLVQVLQSWKILMFMLRFKTLSARDDIEIVIGKLCRKENYRKRSNIKFKCQSTGSVPSNGLSTTLLLDLTTEPQAHKFGIYCKNCIWIVKSWKLEPIFVLLDFHILSWNILHHTFLVQYALRAGRNMKNENLPFRTDLQEQVIKGWSVTYGSWFSEADCSKHLVI